MTQDEKAKKICCRQCRAGVGERCFDQRSMRPGSRNLRIKTVHPIRIADAKARGI